MMIHKITSSVENNEWLKLLDIQLNELTNENSNKVIKPMNKKTLGTSGINSPMSPIILYIWKYWQNFMNRLLGEGKRENNYRVDSLLKII